MISKAVIRYYIIKQQRELSAIDDRIKNIRNNENAVHCQEAQLLILKRVIKDLEDLIIT